MRGPDGVLYADPGAALPGRGVWVTARSTARSDAVKGKVFARSLKMDVSVPPDLAEKVGTLLERRALDALSLANKAGRVTTGFEKIDALLVKEPVAALLHARDASSGGSDKLDRKYTAVSRAKLREPRIVTLFTVEKFLSEAGRVERYRPALVEEIGNSDASGA